VAVAASILPRMNVALLVGWVLLLLGGLLLTHEPLPVSDPAMVVGVGYTIGMLMAVSLTSVGIAIYVWRVAHENRRMADAFLESQIALARAQQTSALGALAAASAHEMGTPLATIALVAREIERDLPGDSPLREDVELILTQADRCRDSLAALAREPEISGGDPYERLTISQLIDEVVGFSAPIGTEDVDIEITADSLDGSSEPVTGRSPELMHGLGNLTQNALSFAATRVEVVATWSAKQVMVEVVDDGPGFPAQILGSIGDPYRTTRANKDGHLGLGIFIASTLLDRTSADVKFSNRPEGGAQIEIRWNRAIFEHKRQESARDPDWSK
jgi:two-component system sensor histidine kinase RegB